MTAPIPPVSGPVGDGTPQERLSAQDTGAPMEIIADHPDLSGMVAQATADGIAHKEAIRPLLESPAGYGLGGFTIDDPLAADSWPSNVDFPHQGP